MFCEGKSKNNNYIICLENKMISRRPSVCVDVYDCMHTALCLYSTVIGNEMADEAQRQIQYKESNTPNNKGQLCPPVCTP